MRYYTIWWHSHEMCSPMQHLATEVPWSRNSSDLSQWGLRREFRINYRILNIIWTRHGLTESHVGYLLVYLLTKPQCYNRVVQKERHMDKKSVLSNFLRRFSFLVKNVYFTLLLNMLRAGSVRELISISFYSKTLTSRSLLTIWESKNCNWVLVLSISRTKNLLKC